MGKKFVSDIKDRSQVDTVFLVREKITAMAKNGKPYLTLKLMDKTGEVEGKVWDNVDELSAAFNKDDFIAVRSKATVYLGKMQLVIAELKKVPDEAVALADFLPEAARAIGEMAGELSSLLATLNDQHLKRLLSAFFDDAAFMSLYSSAPAAKGMHHVYLGGLLEHSLAVARLVDRIAPLYEGLNRDLLVAGALLHDVGKVREMTYSRSFDYTDEGKLLGHITIGVEMIQEKIAAIGGFPQELAMLLKHMLLSHHGQYEFGSPKRPKTVEATILNYLDDLDSKINGIRSHIGKETESSSRWTSYHRLYDRYFYKDNCLDEGEPVEPDVAPREEEPPPQVRQEKAEPGRKGFHNNPFEDLKEKNLDLF
ncbi:MAG TPA: HD domain-containing protein [Geobacteraceae bacterium]|nr:HD domain-containing protein [Geobacteraceae bacterium]